MRTRWGLVAFSLLVSCVAYSQEPPRRIRVGEAVQQSSLVTYVAPVYPPVARQARIQGTVRLQVVISKEGRVTSAEVISGHPLMQQAALEVVQQWVYRPTLLNGDPVEVVTTVSVNFTLEDSSAPNQAASAAGAEGAPSAALRAPVAAVDPAVQIARLREHIAVSPENENLQRQLGQALIRNREIEAGIAALREAARLNPENLQTRIAVAQTLLFEKSDYHGAVAEYREVLLRKPDDFAVCSALARAHEFVYDYAQATLQHAECVQLRPSEIDGYRQLASALYRKEKLERATTEFRKYTAYHSNPAELHFRIAESFENSNQAAALAQAREALRVRPDYAEARQQFSRVEAFVAESQDKIAEVRGYIARNPKDANGYQALAYLLHGVLADHEGAWAAYREMLAASPEFETNLLADEAVEARGFDGAISDLRKLVRTLPNSPAVHLALAGLLLKKGLSAEAAEVAREAVRLAPENRQSHTVLARALSAGNDSEGAREQIKLAGTLPPRIAPPSINPELMGIMRRATQGSQTDPVVAANEASAVGSLRTLNTVLVMYASTYKNGYAASLATLGPGNPSSAQQAGLIDAGLASGTKSGYFITYMPGSQDASGKVESYSISAVPAEPGKTGRRFFFTDQSGIIRYSTSGPAGPSSPPIG